MTCFLNIAMPLDLRSTLGWVLMGVAGFNILANMCATCFQSVKDLLSYCKLRGLKKKAHKILYRRLENREKLVEEYPGEFKHFNYERVVHRKIEFCKEWSVHRSWLKANGLKFDDFEEEIKF